MQFPIFDLGRCEILVLFKQKENEITIFSILTPALMLLFMTKFGLLCGHP